MKQVILMLALVVVIAGIVLGAYLPWAKATSYISALRNLPNVTSMDGFVKNFDEPLNMYSPVGDEEVVKFLSNDILQLVNQKDQPEVVSRALVNFIEPRLMLNNVRHLLTGAQMHDILWMKFHSQDDYKLTEQYFLKALEIGPRLPPVLYGLLDLYRASGEKTKMQNVAKIIVGYWPSDSKTAALLK